MRPAFSGGREMDPEEYAASLAVRSTVFVRSVWRQWHLHLSLAHCPIGRRSPRIWRCPQRQVALQNILAHYSASSARRITRKVLRQTICKATKGVLSGLAFKHDKIHFQVQRRLARASFGRALSPKNTSPLERNPLGGEKGLLHHLVDSRLEQPYPPALRATGPQTASGEMANPLRPGRR